MKPRVRPVKGRKYRIVIVDDEGNYVFYDVNDMAVIREEMSRLTDEIEEKKWKRKAREAVKRGKEFQLETKRIYRTPAG